MLLEILADLGGAELARQPVRPRLGVALVRELLSLCQVVKQRLERLRRFGMRRQLAGELGARVLAPCQEPQGPDLQLRGRVRPLGLHTCGSKASTSAGERTLCARGKLRRPEPATGTPASSARLSRARSVTPSVMKLTRGSTTG